MRFVSVCRQTFLFGKMSMFGVRAICSLHCWQDSVIHPSVPTSVPPGTNHNIDPLEEIIFSRNSEPFCNGASCAMEGPNCIAKSGGCNGVGGPAWMVNEPTHPPRRPLFCYITPRCRWILFVRRKRDASIFRSTAELGAISDLSFQEERRDMQDRNEASAGTSPKVNGSSDKREP